MKLIEKIKKENLTKILNPIYLKEIRMSVRSKKAGVILFLFNGLLAFFGLFFFYVVFDASSRYTGRIEYIDILNIYTAIVAVEFALVIFTVPGLTSGAISSEREKQTLDILLTTTLSPLRIIIGKLTSSISAMLLLAFSSFPILALVFAIGGIGIIDLIEFMVLIIVTAIFIGSIGIFFSTLYKRTTPATVSSYGTILVLVLASFFIVWAVKILAELNINIDTIEDGYYPNTDIGNWVLVFLINPAVTCYSMLQGQIGTGYELNRFLSQYGIISDWIISYWFIISITIQLVISLVLILISSCLLDPLRRKCPRWMKGG